MGAGTTLRPTVQEKVDTAFTPTSRVFGRATDGVRIPTIIVRDLWAVPGPGRTYSGRGLSLSVYTPTGNKVHGSDPDVGVSPGSSSSRDRGLVTRRGVSGVAGVGGCGPETQ